MAEAFARGVLISDTKAVGAAEAAARAAGEEAEAAARAAGEEAGAAARAESAAARAAGAAEAAARAAARAAEATGALTAAAATLAGDAGPIDQVALAAAQAAAEAAEAAGAAAWAAWGASWGTVGAVGAAVEAVEAAGAAAVSDFNGLLALNLGQPLTLGQPIDPSETGPLGPLWPDGSPDWYRHPPKRTDEGTPESRSESADENTPSLVIVWDPEILGPDDYAKLVTALGDLVRAEGGVGIERIRSRGFGVPCEAGVLQ
jgi:hypothetical protein